MDDSQRNHPPIDYDLIREYSSGTFCRLCFSQIYDLHRIFPPNGMPNKLLVKKIEFCTEISIAFATDSNACICNKCVSVIEEFFRFKQLCSANEQWLKTGHAHHVAGNEEEGCVQQPPGSMSSSDSCSSLLTIDTEQVGTSNETGNSSFGNSSLTGTSLRIDELIGHINAENSGSTEVTSSGPCFRARKSTTRLGTSIPLNVIQEIAIKSEHESDIAAEDSASSEGAAGIDKPIDEAGPAGSKSFKLVHGSKTRSNRLYLEYKNYRFSNPSNDGKIWRCTHRAPDYCRVVVMLDKNQVLELNNHRHNHPPPTMSKKQRIVSIDSDGNANTNKNVKISLVLKKEKNLPRRASRSRNQLKPGDHSKWFIEENRKTVDGFTYTFCGLRKDGVIRLKCITKGCSSRIHMYSSGDLVRINTNHCHAPHVPV